jgi:hypothetical protein
MFSKWKVKNFPIYYLVFLYKIVIFLNGILGGLLFWPTLVCFDPNCKKKNQMSSLHIIKWKIGFFSLTFSFFELRAKNVKESYTKHVSWLPQKKPTSLNIFLNISLFVVYIFFDIKHKCIIIVEINFKIY